MIEKMKALLIAFCFGLVTAEAPNYDDLIASLMTKDMTPNPGPEMGTAYVPGTPGGQWSEEEIEITRFADLNQVENVVSTFICLLLKEAYCANDPSSVADQINHGNC